MSCNRCANQSEAAMQAAGVPARQTQATWAQSGGSASPGQCLQCGAFLTRQGQCLNPKCGQEDTAELITLSGHLLQYLNQTLCELCCSVKLESGCLRCFFHKGQIPAFDLPGSSRWMVGDKEQVTADELAQAFAGPGEQGRLVVLNMFPGLVSRLGEDGKQALWTEVRRYPDKALLFNLPAALVEAGGVEHLVQAARRAPAALRASLNTLDAIRQLYLEGIEITQEALDKRLSGQPDDATAPSTGAAAKDADDTVATMSVGEEQTGPVTQDMRDSFKAQSASVTRARANKTLSVKMNYDKTGAAEIQGVMTRREFVERAYELGWEWSRVKIRKTKFWSIGNILTTKTEVDYLKHLQSFDEQVTS